MKNLCFTKNNLLASIGILLFASLWSISCSDNKAMDPKNHLTDEEQINEMFTLVDSKITTRVQTLRQENGDKVMQKAITFLVIKDNKSGQIGLANFKEETIFGPITLMMSKKTQNIQNSGGGYVVSCTGGSEGDWEKECSGKFSCGKAIAECLDQGGCANICEKPQEKEELVFNAEEYLGLSDRDDLTLTDLEDISVVEIARLP